MSNYAIKIRDLGKEYRIGKYQEPYTTFRDTIVRTAQAPFKRMGQILRGEAYGASNLTESIWALKDISFDVKHGEVVGIIGHNGAGKSTLLKILSQITEPSAGEVQLYGRVGSLLEVGTGFHEELTGRENIFLNGAILGMGRTEINRKFDEIVDFSGVEKFIDTPVKHYSSGMKLRLGFAVAAHLEPEILVVDEVLAVGDAAFQKKCLGKMEDVAASGRTVLFVSHNMAAVENLCSRGIVLNQGTVTCDTSTSKAIEHYMRSLENIASSQMLTERTDRSGTGELRFTNISLQDVNGNPIHVVSSGQTFDICLHYESTTSEQFTHVRAGITCFTQLSVPVFSQNTGLNGLEFSDIPKQGAFILRVENLPLPPSTYPIRCTCKINNTYADNIENAFSLDVVDGDFFGTGKSLPIKSGVVYVKGQWRCEEAGVLVNE